MLGGFVSFYGYLKFMHTIAWIPWVYGWIERVLGREELRERPFYSGVLLGMIVGMAFLSGAPGGFFYFLLAAALYFFFRFYQKARNLRGMRQLALQVLPILGWGVLWSMGLSLVVILPVMEILPMTARLGGGYTFMAQHGFHPNFWWGLLAPDLPSVFDGRRLGQLYYYGTTALLLASAGLFLSRRKQRGLVLFFWVVSLLGLLFSTGDYTHTIALLYYLVPGASFFRAPERYAYLLNVALPIAAAFGMQALLDAFSGGFSRPMKRWFFFTWLLLLCLAGLLISFVLLGTPSVLRRSLGVRYALVVAVSSLLLIRLAWSLRRRLLVKPQRWFSSQHLSLALGGILLLIAFLETFPWQNYQYFQPWENFLSWSNPSLRESPRGFLAPYRVMNDIEPGSRNASALYAVRDVYNYPNPLLSKRHLSLLDALPYSPQILRFFNVEHVLLSRPHAHLAPLSLLGNSRMAMRSLTSSHRHSPWIREGIKGDVEGFRLRDPVPRLLWLPAVRLVRSFDESLGFFRLADPWRAATVEIDSLMREPKLPALLIRADASPSARGRAGKLLRATMNTLEGEIDAPQKGVVIFNESWMPGWKAWRDGQKTPVFRINGLLCGIVVPAGKHTLRFVYQPLGFPWVLWLWGFFLVAGFAILLFAPLSKRHR
jgi:hypothetical protein